MYMNSGGLDVKSKSPVAGFMILGETERIPGEGCREGGGIYESEDHLLIMTQELACPFDYTVPPFAPRLF